MDCRWSAGAGTVSGWASHEGGPSSLITQEPESRKVHTPGAETPGSWAGSRRNAQVSSGLKQALWWMWNGGQQLQIEKRVQRARGHLVTLTHPPSRAGKYLWMVSISFSFSYFWDPSPCFWEPAGPWIRSVDFLPVLASCVTWGMSLSSLSRSLHP